MRVRVPVLLAGGGLVLGSLPVTEHVSRCAAAAPCPSTHAVVVLPGRVASGIALALLTYVVARAVHAVARAAARPVLSGEAGARALSALALAVLVAPASAAVGAVVSSVWGSAPRSTGWAQLPLGLLSGSLVAVALLGCAAAALLSALQATAGPEAA